MDRSSNQLNPVRRRTLLDNTDRYMLARIDQCETPSSMQYGGNIHLNTANRYLNGLLTTGLLKGSYIFFSDEIVQEEFRQQHVHEVAIPEPRSSSQKEGLGIRQCHNPADCGQSEWLGPIVRFRAHMPQFESNRHETGSSPKELQ